MLNCNFRHATRSWKIELPRGAVDPGETPEMTARREVLEETGMVVESIECIGTIPRDTGLISSVLPVFIAQVIGEKETLREDSEAIEKILVLSRNEIKQVFAPGYYICNIREEEKKVPFRDPFLAYAILLSEIRKSSPAVKASSLNEK